MIERDRQAREVLHGSQYVQRFSDERQVERVSRLMGLIDLPPRASVLDIGCGTGLLASLLATRYSSYTGVDFSQAMVHEARRLARERGLQECHFVVGDAVEAMRQTIAAYDAIFLLDISEHVPDDEWATIIEAAWHSLRSGGKVYLHTPNLDFVVERLKELGWMRQFPEHVAVRSAAGNMGFFRDAGYSSISCSALPHYNILRWLHPLTRLPLVGKFMAARLWIVATR